MVLASSYFISIAVLKDRSQTSIMSITCEHLNICVFQIIRKQGPCRLFHEVLQRCPTVREPPPGSLQTCRWFLSWVRFSFPEQKSDNAGAPNCVKELKLLGVVLGIRVIPMWNQGNLSSLTLFLRHLFQIYLFNNSHRLDSKMFATQEWGPEFYSQHPDKKLCVMVHTWVCHC